MPPHPYCAAALSNRIQAGCMNQGKEGMAVRTPDQRELRLSGYRTRPDTGPRIALRLLPGDGLSHPEQ